MPKFDPNKGNLRQILFSIARRRTIDYARSKGRSKIEYGAGGNHGDDEGGGVIDNAADARSQTPDAILIENETQQRQEAAARRAVDTISQTWRSQGKEREADIWDVAWNGAESDQDIARRFSVKPQQVYNIKAKARKKLIELLADFDNQE